jgi:rod shape-determining protein MreB
VLSKKIAIDLGTSTVRVYVKGEGLVISEPAVLATKPGSSRPVAFGNDVPDAFRRAPDSVHLRFPVVEGVIADLPAAEWMIHHVIDKVQGRQRIFRPEVMICVPISATSHERRALTEAAISAGARQVWLIDEPLAAAIGVGLPIAGREASAICNVGGGTTEMAVIAESGTVVERSVKGGGNRMDAAVAAYLLRKYSLEVDERAAEAVKIAVGSAVGMNSPLVTEVMGRDLRSGSPRSVEVLSNDVVEAVGDSLRLIADAFHELVQEAPRALAASINQRGVVLCGGAARLRGIDLYITGRTGIPATVAEEPETSAVRGTSMALENFEVVKRNQSYAR